MFDQLTLTREELLAFSVGTRDEIITSVMRRTAETPMTVQRFAGGPGISKSVITNKSSRGKLDLLTKLSLEGAFTRAGVLAYVQQNPGTANSAIVLALGGGLAAMNPKASTVRVGSLLQQLKVAGLIMGKKITKSTGLGDKVEWYPVG